MFFTEEQLRNYAKPLGENEEKQCENAIKMIVNVLKNIGFQEKNAIKRMYLDTPTFQVNMKNIINNYDINIFLQGSYANNTNVRQHSDIDIAIVQEDIFIPKYRSYVSDENYGFQKAIPRSKSFKDLIEEILRKNFGEDVERKNKSIKINGNSYRKDADTVPAIRHKDYSNDYYNNPNNYIGGILIYADDGEKIVNYPEQHIRNGIEKNKLTNLYFKKMVRIAKELRYQMCDLNYKNAKKTSSFGIECLLYNIPNEIFIKSNKYVYIFDEIVKYLYRYRYSISNFKEVNGIKKLFDSNDKEIIYRNFIEEIKGFYEYEI